jgi:ABC-type methionine transport system ATPase subunit
MLKRQTRCCCLGQFWRRLKDKPHLKGSKKLHSSIYKHIVCSAIACALVDKPRILLFDEANLAMDRAGDAMLRGLMERLRGRVTMILVTSLPSMLNLSECVYDIVDGSLIQRGGVAGQLKQPSSQVVPT